MCLLEKVRLFGFRSREPPRYNGKAKESNWDFLRKHAAALELDVFPFCVKIKLTSSMVASQIGVQKSLEKLSQTSLRYTRSKSSDQQQPCHTCGLQLIYEINHNLYVSVYHLIITTHFLCACICL
jgi:hypothetical protein